jgi:hypothetical protein
MAYGTRLVIVFWGGSVSGGSIILFLYLPLLDFFRWFQNDIILGRKIAEDF